MPAQSSVLSRSQKARLNELEEELKDVWYRAGLALAEIKRDELYTEYHKTFDEYCTERQHITRRHADRLINSALVMQNLSESEGPNRSDLILPKNEQQVRSLSGLDPEDQVKVWQDSVEDSDGKQPSGRVVENNVLKFRSSKLPALLKEEEDEEDEASETFLSSSGIGRRSESIRESERKAQHAMDLWQEVIAMMGEAEESGSEARRLYRAIANCKAISDAQAEVLEMSRKERQRLERERYARA